MSQALSYSTRDSIQFLFQSQQTESRPVVLLGILGGGVPPGSPNPNPISDQKMSFSTLGRK